MPRTSRIKSNDSIYHVMIRSVGDIKLYKDKQDKNKYLELIKRYQIKFGFKVYAYCLMDNHGHLLIDSNGADISKFMHGINQCYAQFFNRRHNRNGHVFGDRFKSKIVSDDRYLITLSGYIHNNPKDVKKYKDNPQKYPYSSLSIYLGISEDRYDILEENYVLELFDKILNNSRKQYLSLINRNEDIDIKNSVEFKDQKTDYRSERVIIARDYTPNEIICFVSSYTKINKEKIIMKYNRESTEGKAIIILLMSRFCNFSIKNICQVLGNITQSRVSVLCRIGIDLIFEKRKYENIINDFIKEKVG